MNIKNSLKKFAIIAIFTFVIHSLSPFSNTADISIITSIPVNAMCTRSYSSSSADLLIKSLFSILTSYGSSRPSVPIILCIVYMIWASYALGDKFVCHVINPPSVAIDTVFLSIV